MPKNIIKYILLFMFITGMLVFIACSHRDDSSVEDADNNMTIDKDTDIIRDGSSDTGELNIEEGNQTSNQAITFVQQDYFYKDTVYIEIDSDKPCDIYFTMDGSEPDKTKSLYQDKIELKTTSQVKVYTIKAKGYYEDEAETDTIVHTYFVGKGINNRFSTLVFSITSDPYNLYDYENGILIPGKLRDDFVRSNPDKEIEPPDPANFNMRGRESEREAFLEIFESDGTVVASQNVGIRVYGGWSRANLQKSIKIFARKSYDEINNKIRYQFFPDKTTVDGNGTAIRAFKRLVLRNSGNDNGFGFIRDELFQTLACQAGFRDYEAVRPVTLFINGDYRGQLWLHEVYCDEYFEQLYGEYKGSFEILEGGETFKQMDEDGVNQHAIEDYEQAYSYTYRNLTNEAVYNKLCEAIDVENYLEYYALQIFIGNEDWPHNNYKVYRYYAAEGEEYREAPFDGKWRYLIHDLDFSYGIYGTEAWEDNLQKYVSEPGNISNESPLFSQLLQREDCKRYFIIKTLDLINGAFSPDNLNMVLDEMDLARMSELSRMYGKNLIADWVMPSQLYYRLDIIKEYNSDRIDYTLTKYRDYFDLGKVYYLKVEPAKGAGVRINNIEVYSDLKGRFYSNYDTVISPIVPVGREFSHWIINGEAKYDLELNINSSYIVDGNVKVTYKLKDKVDDPRIIISKICTDGDEDYIMLLNPYKEDVSLLGYSITDDIGEPGKLIFPARRLKAGHSLKILGESNRETTSTGMIRAGFNLKDGETVALYLRGELVDEVTIPDLKKGNIYVRDTITMKFSEEIK